jgi:hypothetical protein
LAAAFLKPVRQGSNDPARDSKVALEDFADRLNTAYGLTNLAIEIMDTIGDEVKGSLENIVQFGRKAVKD